MRTLGVALVLAVAGAAGGYGVGAFRTDEPVTISMALPVPAEDPSYPSDPVSVVRPDRTFPTLERNLDYHKVSLGTDEFPLDVRVPRDWIGTNPTPGEWRWYPPPGPDNTENTYFLRVRNVANNYRTVPAALDARIEDLAGAAGVSEFDVESRSADTFVATYVSEGYRRVAMERFTTNGGSGNAYAWIAVVGREQDRDGLSSLLESVTAIR